MERRYERVLTIEHDGCAGCKYDELTLYDTPCSHCRGTVKPSDPIWDHCPDFYESDNENPYWDRVCKLAEKQRKKGMGKYGTGLENNPADMLKRIEHLQEELIDALMYCEWMKDELEGKADD
jgi:hypothetical protein